ncbi:MAG: Fic family protein [Nanoarchaeota archaeon]|nr:Fic family protein [Nanoarchaeota archaeon]
MIINGITGEEIDRLHEDLVMAGGGMGGLIRPGYANYVAEAAISPRHNSDLTSGAAFIISRIAKGHPYTDGNKRTAYFAARYFLMRNGADLNGRSVEDISNHMGRIASVSVDRADCLARTLCRKDIVRGSIVVPNYETYHRLVVKSIGVARELGAS